MRDDQAAKGMCSLEALDLELSEGCTDTASCMRLYDSHDKLRFPRHSVPCCALSLQCQCPQSESDIRGSEQYSKSGDRVVKEGQCWQKMLGRQLDLASSRGSCKLVVFFRDREEVEAPIWIPRSSRRPRYAHQTETGTREKGKTTFLSVFCHLRTRNVVRWNTQPLVSIRFQIFRCDLLMSAV